MSIGYPITTKATWTNTEAAAATSAQKVVSPASSSEHVAIWDIAYSFSADPGASTITITETGGTVRFRANLTQAVGAFHLPLEAPIVAARGNSLTVDVATTNAATIELNISQE